ncbi:MAG: alpha/beta fold hydrolase [Deltaproteobacteria bacterium]
MIASHRLGSGPHLVVVHGTGGDHNAWVRTAPILAEHFTLHLVDRRGRGDSGDAGAYALEREFEDVVAVVQGISEAVHLYGHSFGGACALEAALRTPVRSLVLYEGGLKPGDLRFDAPERIAHLQALADGGRREELLVDFMTHEAGVSQADLESLRLAPSWKARVAAAHSIPRELQGLSGYATDFDRVRRSSMRIGCLIGGASIARRREGFAAAAQAVGARVRVLEGQGHAAHQTAPELLAGAISDLVRELAADAAP